MARTYQSPQDLTNNERLVLRRMAMREGGLCASNDFAHIATSKSDRNQWASAILQRLEQFGLVSRSKINLGRRAAYDITEAGRSASSEALPEMPDMSIFEMKALLWLHENGCIKVGEDIDHELLLGLQDAYWNDRATFEPASNGAGKQYWLNLNGRFIEPAQLREAIAARVEAEEAPSP